MKSEKTSREPRAPEPTPIIFIVDDDEAVRAALGMLVHSCGYRARTLSSGSEFFAALAQAWPACLVVNSKLCDMDGATLQHEIARLRMDLPVIVTTAYEDQAGTLQATLDGARAVVAKPFTSNELMSAISRLVEPPRSTGSRFQAALMPGT